MKYGELVAMFKPGERDLLWWLIPGVLAGMPMPYFHPERRFSLSAPLNAYDDELPILHAAGIGAVVSLLNNPSDGTIYHAVDMDFLCLPIPDGYAPTFEQADAFVQFVEENRERNRAVAAHCHAGLGRTGTMLGVYLIAKGADSTQALLKVRAAEPAAIETRHQVLFLDAYAEHCRRK